MRNAKSPTVAGGAFRVVNCGDVLLSHTVSHAVPSALKGLTSGFGMGPGVSPSPKPPNDQPPTPGKHQGAGRTRPSRQGSIILLYAGFPVVSWEPHRDANISQRFILNVQCVKATRPISTGRLHTSPRFHLQPINPVVYRGPYTPKGVGELISRKASRLDAFSGYPDRT